MRQVENWGLWYMKQALAIASRSKDPRTQVGAVIVDEFNHQVSSGYNGFAPGVLENHNLWERPHKYDRVIHAEANAICYAAKTGKALNGCTLYVTHFPCHECAKLIVACGIRKVVAHGACNGEDHLISCKKSINMFLESRVSIDFDRETHEIMKLMAYWLDREDSYNV